MREGYYTDAYFNHTREVLIRDDRHPRVVMQVFQKHDSYLGGVDEAIAVLKLCADDWDDLTVHALYDGDPIEPFEPVLRIEGDYTGFAHLETVYLGVLARRTLITSNVVRVLEAANGKPIIFMPARHDHHRVQTGDGYAAFVGGQVVGTEIGVTSEAQASWWGGRGIGTVPHALIAAYGGNTVLAATKFVENVDPEMNVTVLVDFENDSVQTALEVARALGPRLWGVRLDTSGQLVDRSLWGEMGDFDPRGVNEQLDGRGGTRSELGDAAVVGGRELRRGDRARGDGAAGLRGRLHRQPLAARGLRHGRVRLLPDEDDGPAAGRAADPLGERARSRSTTSSWRSTASGTPPSR